MHLRLLVCVVLCPGGAVRWGAGLMSVGYPRKTLNITSSQDTSLYATEMEYHTAHLGPSRVCPQTCNVARALAGSSREPRARDRPVAQTSGPAFSCSCSGLWYSWQKQGWHRQGGCKLYQYLIVPMAWVYPLPTGAPGAGPGSWLCVLA